MSILSKLREAQAPTRSTGGPPGSVAPPLHAPASSKVTAESAVPGRFSNGLKYFLGHLADVGRGAHLHLRRQVLVDDRHKLREQDVRRHAVPVSGQLDGQRLRQVENQFLQPVPGAEVCQAHLIGAAGAVEAVALALTLHGGVLPPTINLAKPDPECDLDYVPNCARKIRVRTAVSTSFGFGGQNAALVMRRFQG